MRASARIRLSAPSVPSGHRLAGDVGPVLDPGDLAVGQVDRVVDVAHRVGVGEPDDDLDAVTERAGQVARIRRAGYGWPRGRRGRHARRDRPWLRVYGRATARGLVNAIGLRHTRRMDEPVALWTTIAGRWGPVYIAATDRGVVAIEWLTTEEAFEAAVARRLGGGVVRAGTVKWNGRAEQHLDEGVKWRRVVPGRQTGQERSRRSTLPTGRPGTGPCWMPWRRSRGAGPPATVRSRAGSVRRGRRGRWAARSGATRSRSSIPCHRVIASDGTLGGWGGDRWGDLQASAPQQAGPAAARGRHRDPESGLDSAATVTRTRLPGEPMSTAAARPIDVRGLPQARFRPPLAGPAGLDRGLVADRPRRRHLGLSRDRFRPGGRPDPDGDRGPQPRRRPARGRLRRSARPQADPDRDLPGPGGDRRRSSRS